MYSHCTPCHHDEGIAPFALESYEDAFAQRLAMEAAISGKVMPPWPPDPEYTRLAGERVLTEDEIRTFRFWVENGAPIGNSAEEISPPEFQTSVKISDPDFTYTLPPFTVPDVEELDLYRCFLIPTDEDKDRFITGVEILPGNRSIVHHVLLFADTSRVPRELDEEDPGAGYTCFGGIGSNSFSMISGWVPGSDANFAPEGMGIFLPEGADLIVQLHYPEGSAGLVDATTINLQFSEDPNLREIINIPAINHFTSLEDPLFIPANTKRTFHATQVVPFDLTITGIAPHAHLICESMRAFAITPIGDTIKLIDIPHWDFEWQGFYDFQIAKKLPFGSVLHGIATYNNTSSNAHLPHDPAVDVSLGEATTDEMLLFFMSLSFYQDGDEHMIIDTASHQPHHQQCTTFADLMTSSRNAQMQNLISVGPNPTSGELWIRHDLSTSARMQPTAVVMNSLGQRLLEWALTERQSRVALPTTWPEGLYWLQITQGNHLISNRKFTLLRP